MGIFLVLFGIVVLISDSFKFYTFIAFILEALTPLILGYIGRYVAKRANVRTKFQGYKFFKQSQETNENTAANSLIHSFYVAFREGCSMGFLF